MEGRTPEGNIMGKRIIQLIAAALLLSFIVYSTLVTSLTMTTKHPLPKRPKSVQHQSGIVQGIQSSTSPYEKRDNKSDIHPTEAFSKLRKEMSCRLKKNVPFSTITRKQAPRDKHKAVLPEESLEKQVHFNSCAVVSSSHALKFHTYGQEIDRHDAVLRFNCAPTDQFEEYVGSRTDIRLINTLIPERTCQKEFWGDNTTMFRHETIVIRNLDGINLGRQVVDVKNDVHHAFANLIKYRSTYPNRSIPFIQRPRFGQGIKKEMEWFCASAKKCDKTRWSPSSGTFGVVMMLHLCDWVHVYEMVPSNKDDTKIVHYYDETAGRSPHDLHAYGQERTYLRTLSLTTEKDIEETGVVLLKGLSQFQCS